MLPDAPTAFLTTLVLAFTAVVGIGFSLVWVVFAVTLFVTTVVAIHRSIPRKEL